MLWIAFGLVLLVASFVAGRLSRRNADAILPPPVVTAVAHEKADRARVDSQLIAATLEATAAAQRQAIATARADSLADIAKRIGRYADRLAARAASAETAQDSATYYREAYQVRTDETDTLRYELAEKDSALVAANARALAFQRATVVADSARQRADSVIDAVVEAAKQAECRVPLTFGAIHCMSRTKAAIVGGVIGIGAKMTYDAIWDGRLKIPLRLP
jgi:hypothetical protein